MLIEFIKKDEDLPSIYSAPIPAKSLLPDWYKNAYPTINNEELKIINFNKRNGTYKKCVPFMDAMTSGYVVTLPADILVSKDDNNEVFCQWMVNGNIISLHGEQEHPGFPIPEDYNNRVFTWLGSHIIKTPKGYSCIFTHPINQNDLPFKVITGIVDTDSYLNTVDFPFIIKNNFTGIIPAGTPICQIIPFKRVNWTSKITYMSKTELRNWFNSYISKINSAYRYKVWNKKKYD